MATDLLTIDEIYAARERIRSHVVHTPLMESLTLGKVSGRRVFCKFENLQMTGAFKERGALNKLLQLTDEDRRRGVIAASAGNHAQGLAYHGGRLDIPVTIVMPEHTPIVKVLHTQEMGARVIQIGEGFDDAHAHACELARREGLVFVHPFDDPDVIAGQGTIALELVEDCAAFDSVLVPVGGGGLISGVALAMKHLRPDVSVVGVEARNMASMAAALAGHDLKTWRKTIADGIAVRQVGRLTRAIAGRNVDVMLSVSEEGIAHAVQLMLEIEKSLVEGAGAVGLAALLQHPEKVPGESSVLILSGGNLDITMLARIIEKGLVADGRLTRLKVEVPDVPGGLASVTARISKEKGNIREVIHQRAFYDTPIGIARVEFIVETRSKDHVRQIVDALAHDGYEVEALS